MRPSIARLQVKLQTLLRTTLRTDTAEPRAEEGAQLGGTSRPYAHECKLITVALQGSRNHNDI